MFIEQSAKRVKRVYTALNFKFAEVYLIIDTPKKIKSLVVVVVLIRVVGGGC